MSNGLFLSVSPLIGNANGLLPADGRVLALFFLIPLLLYILLYWLVRPARRMPMVALIATICVATISLLGVRQIVFNSTPWPNSTQVVWTGVAAPNTLTIGGSRDGAIVGWPRGAFAPSLTATKITPGDEAEITVAGGGGFVYDENKRVMMNGEDLMPGEPKTFGRSETHQGYTLTLGNSYLLRLIPWGRQMTIAEDGKTLAVFSIPARAEINRVYSLVSLVESAETSATADEETTKKNFMMKDWAADILLLITPQNTVRILERTDSPPPCRVSLPARLSIFWTNLRLETELKSNGDKLVLEFLPPWRTACPIPPAAPDGNTSLAFTGRALPGDYAFLLPLGGGAELHKILYITRDSSRGPIFSSLADQINGTANANLPPNIRERLASKGGDADGRTSEIEVVADSGYTFKVATANNIPGQAATTWLVALAFVIFVVGLLLTFHRHQPESTWCVYGIAATVWNLLSLRLLLSLRYALPPDNLDRFVVKGITLALVGLTLIPALLLIAARLRRDAYNPPPQGEQKHWSTLLSVIGYIVLVGIACLVEYKYAASLWVNLPPRFIYSVGWGVSLLLFGIFVYLLLRSIYLYARPLLDRAPSSFKQVYLFLSPLIVLYDFLDFVRRSFALLSDLIWSRMATEKRIKPLTAFLFLGLALVSLFMVCFVIGRVSASDTLIHDIIIPFIFCWPPAILWLASVKFFPPSKKALPRFWRILYLAIPTILLPIFLVPPAVGDVGSLLGSLAIFLPMISILWAARVRPCRGAAVLSLVLALGCALLLYINLNFISTYVSRVPGTRTALTRMLIYREGGVGGAIQKYITYAAIGRRGDSNSAPLTEIRNGFQHTQENKHIMNRGGLLGRGFGIAPVRNSQIRQDTLQYDSVYSFFVCGEYGLLGGICVLLLYAMPLILVLISGRRRFDIGHAIATMITGAIFIEALFHAGMNTGAFPFTGRNLPLLAVGSLTDLMRWSILLCVATQAVLWRYQNGKINEKSAALFEQPAPTGRTEPDAKDHGAGQPRPVRKNLLKRLQIWLASVLRPNRGAAQSNNTTTPRPGGGPRRRRFAYGRAVIFILLIPAFMMFCVVWTGVVILRNKELKQPFSWSDELEYVKKEIIDKKRLLVDQDTYTIKQDETLGALPDEFIEQERQRFNTLLLDERIEVVGQNDFLKELEKVKDLDGYDKLFDEFHRKHPLEATRRRPSLFRLVPAPEDPNETVNKSSVKSAYNLDVNPAFNTFISFDTAQSSADIPQVMFSDTGRNARGALIGPAWVMGRWVSSYDPNNNLLPWTRYLANMIENEPSMSDSAAETVATKYGTLTLNRQLQEAAMKFTAEHGRELHGELLRTESKKENKLPPRVGLSILDLPRGRVLALGGWPRMTSDYLWRKTSTGWVPPVMWLEGKAPRELRERYGGDRNFARYIMGSSTKPLWASAVLRIYPYLKDLSVKGPENENQVFGIQIADKKYNTKPESNAWLGFDTYLKISSNRYQVRLGFLGLALPDGDKVATDGDSRSDLESFDRVHPWGKYPKFPDEIGFSHEKERNRKMQNLKNQRLATLLRDMYSINIGTGDFLDHRLSFWTNDEADDLARNSGSARPGTNVFSAVRRDFFNQISPETVDFNLDSIDRPRTYVSLLLGDEPNKWANVDFAGAFGTCITGRPVIPHIVATPEESRPLAVRTEKTFADVAAILRPGLAEVVRGGRTSDGYDGTAYELESSKALEFIHKMPGVEIYAKTGTLSIQPDKEEQQTQGNEVNWKRLVIALVKWDDEHQGLIQSGLVFSIVVERDKLKQTIPWLGKFLNDNKDIIKQLLDENRPTTH